MASIWSHIPTLKTILQKEQQTRSSALCDFLKVSFTSRAPLSVHLIIGLAMTFARSLTLFSLVYLNYPTQVIFKSMKLLFVLVGSMCCFGKSYSLIEVSGHVSMVFAAILFSLGDHETQTRFTIIGVVLVVSSLIFDSIHANFQEYALRKCKATSSELMIFSNGVAAMLSGTACIVSGEIYVVKQFVESNPDIWMLFIIRSLAIYIGAVAYLTLTKRFGAVVASEVTTARKVLTIISSYYLFPKPFILKHQFGSLSFALAVVASMYAKRQSNSGKQTNG